MFGASRELSLEALALEQILPADASDLHMPSQPSNDDVTMQSVAVASAASEEKSEHTSAPLGETAAGATKHQNLFKGFFSEREAHHNRPTWPKLNALPRAYPSLSQLLPAYQRRSRDWGASLARDEAGVVPGLLQRQEGREGGTPSEAQLNAIPLPAPPPTVAAQQLRQLSATRNQPGEGSPTLSSAYNEPLSVRRNSEAGSSNSSQRSVRLSLDSRLPSLLSDSNYREGAAPQPPLLNYVLVHTPPRRRHTCLKQRLM